MEKRGGGIAQVSGGASGPGRTDAWHAMRGPQPSGDFGRLVMP